jgi:hypothetical protein
MRARMVALLVLAGVFGGAALGQDFKQYASGAGRYKVMFPGDPKSETNDIKAGKNTLKFTIDFVELKGDTTFSVSFIDAPDDVAKQPPGPRLDKVRDGNKGESGKVHHDKDVQVGLEKYPGRDLLIEGPSGYTRNRVVIAGNRLYQVMIQGSKEVVTSPSADKFIASFEVTK